MKRIGTAKDYRKYLIKPGPADTTPEWEADPAYAPTLAEARKKRTEVARGIGLPSRAIYIFDATRQRIE